MGNHIVLVGVAIRYYTYTIEAVLLWTLSCSGAEDINAESRAGEVKVPLHIKLPS